METNETHEPWNKGKLVGQKPPLKPKDIWAIRIYLQNEHQLRDLAMFILAIDSKLRGYDLVNLHVRDVTHADQITPRPLRLSLYDHQEAYGNSMPAEATLTFYPPSLRRSHCCPYCLSS